MNFRKILEEINFIQQCRKYSLSLWQCPNFLFLIMGIIIIILILTAYGIISQYIQEPQIVALIVLGIATLLLIISFIITNSLEKLVEANRTKTEFINIVSHQLRTPISNLKWAIEFLVSGRLGKIEQNQMEYLNILKENSLRMANLVKDLLTVSRLEAGKIFFKKEFFSLHELTKQVLEDFLPFAKEKKIILNLLESDVQEKVFADRFQIRQVIENLVDNAIRYSKENGLIKVWIEKKDKKVYFKIKDEGIGIPKEEQKFIFQKLFRSSSVLKYSTEGTGLGLYLAKQIIEKSGGKIGFESQQNKGSIFWFYLPIK